MSVISKMETTDQKGKNTIPIEHHVDPPPPIPKPIKAPIPTNRQKHSGY